MSEFGGLLLRGREAQGRDFTSLRVAVLAPGREAARIVPEVVRTARAVKVFQEGPDWIVPVWLPRVVVRPAARLQLRLAVRDPWTRRRLTPDARYNRRPPLVDRRYYEALQRPNCTLISWPVYAIVPGGVRSAEGVEHRVDCLVLGSSSAFAGSTTSPATLREDLTA